MIQKSLDEMNLMDDFLLNRVVSDPEYGNVFTKRLLQIILGREPGKILVVPQRTEYGENTGRHGIRLDVYLDEEDAGIYDLEVDRTVNPADRKSLPKRVRFYHAKIDANTLASGTAYGKLRDVCVIFILNYDPFGMNRMVYTVKNTCREEPDMPYEDGASSIFLYTKGTVGNPEEALRHLLYYMENTSEQNAVDRELKEIHHIVTKVKEKGETGLAYFGLCEKIEKAERQAEERGLERGMKQGMERGMEQGLEQGMERGMTETRIEDILFFLENFGSVPDDLEKSIHEEKDADTLKQWLRAAVRAKSMEEFRQAVSL